ncbi:hypothetical protein [Kineosporia sp. R_H_3]|uniref:hypothetical protein n=1 Tax=Kineosporia sp. R_H_3 TaxID=1961848 RepID=UPI000B4AA259|nr:hypothetical protein [Kineosporia sp. R_H_3]
MVDRASPQGRFWQADGSFLLTEGLLSSARRIAGLGAAMGFVGWLLYVVVDGYLDGRLQPHPVAGTLAILAFLGPMLAALSWAFFRTVSRAVRHAVIIRVDVDGVTLGTPPQDIGVRHRTASEHRTAWGDVAGVRTYGLTWEVEVDDKRQNRFGWFFQVDHRDGTADRRQLPDSVGDGAQVLAAVRHLAPGVPVRLAGRLPEYADPLT